MPTAHPQGLGDLLGRPPFHAGLPERLPGRLGEFAADSLGRPCEQASAVLGLEEGRFFTGRVGLLLQQALHVGIAGAVRMPSPGGEEIDDQVAGDPGEPPPERAPVRVRVVPLDRSGHGAEDFLGEILRIGLLKPTSLRKSVHQWTIDLGELAPGPLVARSRRRIRRLGCVLGASSIRYASSVIHEPKRGLECEFFQMTLGIDRPQARLFGCLGLRLAVDPFRLWSCATLYLDRPLPPVGDGAG